MTGDAAKLYSQALFELCLENSNLDEVYNDLNQCRKIFDENPDFIELLYSPLVLTEEKKKIIDKVFGTEGVVHDFICVVTEKSRIRYFGKITDAFNELYDEHYGIAEMTVVTSVPLKPEAREKLLRKLEEKSGKKVKLTEEVDSSIIGGVVLKTKDSLIDGSIRGRLDALASELQSTQHI